MIHTNELFIVNYCHPNCKPFQNIMRLPREQAYQTAYQLAEENPETTAFYRFADFDHYYPRRLKTDQYLYESFVLLGGTPEEKHPLSFVLQGSDFLNKWFGNGTVTKIPVNDIPSAYISFTYGDSNVVYHQNHAMQVLTKDMIVSDIKKYRGTLDQYMHEIEKNHHYIEAQLWSDKPIPSLNM